MADGIPPQRRRCPTYEWCHERAPGHRLHVGEEQLLTTSRGTEIRVSVTANAGQEPVVLIEGAFDHGGPMMEMAELDASEAMELAGFLSRLGRLARGSGKEVR
jgi:hypothetical protein